MTQEKAIEILKALKEEAEGSVWPSLLWMVMRKQTFITTSEQSEQRKILDVDEGEFVENDGEGFDGVMDYLSDFYSDDSDTMKELEYVSDYEQLCDFLENHEFINDQLAYKSVNVEQYYALDEEAGVFLTKEECISFIEEARYNKEEEPWPSALPCSNSLLKDLVKVVTETEWEEE